MSSVSLSPVLPTRTEETPFELKINCVLDEYLRKCINAVVERNKLTMKESSNALFIFCPRT
jgi:hypothetical protein